MPRRPGRPPKEPDVSTYAGRFAARLRTLRERKGWTVEELRDALSGAGLEVPESTLYKWERADLFPSVPELPGLAEAFGVKVRTVLPPD